MKKSNGGNSSDYEDLKKYAEEDKEELKKELQIIEPDIIVCGNNRSLLKIVLGDQLQDEDTWDNMFALEPYACNRLLSSGCPLSKQGELLCPYVNLSSGNLQI